MRGTVSVGSGATVEVVWVDSIQSAKESGVCEVGLFAMGAAGSASEGVLSGITSFPAAVSARNDSRIEDTLSGKDGVAGTLAGAITTGTTTAGAVVFAKSAGAVHA
jgi:hypothetical protein